MTTTRAPAREELIQHVLAQLEEREGEIRQQWDHPTGTPTRHFFLDDLLPEPWSAAIHDAFPTGGKGFFETRSFRGHKRSSAKLSDHDPLLADMTYAIQDLRVVRRIGEILGLTGLEPDPRLYAGGLSMMLEGDFLNPHLDNSHDAEHDRYRRLNLLY